MSQSESQPQSDSGDKYKILKELIGQWVEREKENMQEAREFGVNCPGFNQALGAHDAYKQVLSDINELELEVRFNTRLDGERND